MSRSSLASVAVALLLILLAIGPAAAQTTPPEVPAAPPVRILPTGGLRVESAALLVSGQQGGSIHVAVLALPFPAGPGERNRARVPVLLEIDGTSLLEGQSGDLLRFEVCLYALSGTGSVQGALLETVEIDLARRGDAVARSGVGYVGELALPAGEYSLRVLVRNSLTGEVGLRLLPLPVPERPQGLRALVLPPVFPNPAPDAWIEVRSPAQPEPASPAALANGGLPAAQPVLGVGQEARFEVRAWGLGQVRELAVEVLRPDGAPVIELPARIEARHEDGAGTRGMERLTASFVPSGIEAGRYLIRAVLPKTAAAPPDISSYAAPFVLLTDGGGGKVWAELLGGPAAARQPAGGTQAARRQPEAPQRRQPRFKAGPVRDAYRQALRLLGAGNGTAARQAVAELEAPLVRGPSGSEDLADVELGVARDLTASGPHSLIPVILLHQALYRDAQARRDPLLSTHARELTLRLVDLYAERSGDVAGRKMAARLLLGMTADLVTNAPPGMQNRILQQTLAFDETNTTVLLCLAVQAERTGRYPEAVDHLQKLLRIDPERGEARLRLAINLRRLGKTRDADRLLAGLIQAPAATAPEPWVLALACHELARARIAAGQLDEAEQILLDSLKRLPGDEKLTLQLAQLYDLRRDPTSARKTLARFKPAPASSPGGSSETARHRYNQFPFDLLDQARKELEDSVPEHLPALAAALGSGEAKSGS